MKRDINNNNERNWYRTPNISHYDFSIVPSLKKSKILSKLKLIPLVCLLRFRFESKRSSRVPSWYNYTHEILTKQLVDYSLVQKPLN